MRDGRICFAPSLPSDGQCVADAVRPRYAPGDSSRGGEEKAIRNSVFPSGHLYGGAHDVFISGYVAPRLQSQKSVVGFSASRPRVRVHGISQAEEGRSPPPVCALRTGMSCVRAIASELLTPIDTCENLPSLVWLALNLSSPLDARRRATRRPPATTRVQ